VFQVFISELSILATVSDNPVRYQASDYFIDILCSLKNGAFDWCWKKDDLLIEN